MSCYAMQSYCVSLSDLKTRCPKTCDQCKVNFAQGDNVTWDGSLATTARRQNLPPPPLETLVAPDRAGAGGKAAPRRSLSRSLAVTATEPSVRGLGSGGGSSGSGSLKVNRRTQL